MNAVLKVYADCVSDEPIKEYVCKRLIMKVAKKLEEVSKMSQNAKSDEEATKYSIEFLKTIFPNFESDDLNGIDPTDFFNFMNEVTHESVKILETARKN